MARRTERSSTKKRTAPTRAVRKKPRAKQSIPKKASKKTSSAATTRSTGGTGYQFEDLTAAWLIVKMLRGEVVPGIDQPGDKLQMQTAALGWKIDDLLVSGGPSHEDVARLSISCKSNVHVSSAGLPAAFVGLAWSQWREANPMRRDRDGIALVTRGRHPGFSATWADLKAWCSDSDVASTLAKISASAKHRRVFSSVHDPGFVVRSEGSDRDTVALIRVLEVIPLDFQLAPSTTEQEAVASC